MMCRYACMPQERLRHGAFWVAAVQPGDIESIRVWRNAQIDVLRQKAPLTPEQQQAYYAETIWPSLEMPHPANILLGYHEGDRLIGYGGLVHIAWEDRRAEVSFLLDPALMASPDISGPYIRIFLGLMKQLAFRDLALTRLTTECYAIRTEIIALLETEGFRREGVLREHVRIGGHAVDSLQHGWLAADELALTRATPEDCECLWRWRNDAETRANSLNSKDIAWEVHKAWFGKALQDPARIIFVARVGEVAVGMCRFDIGAEAAEASIALDPAMRGRGLAVPLLSRAVACFREDTHLPLLATVKAHNTASMRCFERCGFVRSAGDGACWRYRLEGI